MATVPRVGECPSVAAARGSLGTLASGGATRERGATRISIVTKMCCGDALDASGLWPDCGGPRAELQSTMVALHIFAIWLLLDALIVVAVL
jgi:hypothetical protein